MRSTRVSAAAVISKVSAEGIASFSVAMFPYCFRSSRNRLLQANTDILPAAEFCPLRVLQGIGDAESAESGEGFRPYSPDVVKLG